jgi:hypothetical protein
MEFKVKKYSLFSYNVLQLVMECNGITCEIMERSGIIYNERHSATESELKL